MAIRARVDHSVVVAPWVNVVYTPMPVESIVLFSINTWLSPFNTQVLNGLSQMLTGDNSNLRISKKMQDPEEKCIQKFQIIVV